MAMAYISDSNDELWRECAKWLTSWDIIRPDHKANWEDSTIADLAAILRDGVFLCKLLNKIDPGCIDMKDVSLKPTMAQFLCLRNINLFLKTCKSSFGLSSSDLFEASMLFELTNFHKVLCTLAKLSRSEKASKDDIKGFSAQTQRREEEMIYQSLNKIQPAVPRGLDLEHSIIVTDSGVTSEEIYQDLCDVRDHLEQNQPQEKRDFVVKELLDTEKNYVEVLHRLKMNFMVPLHGQMKPDDHEVVFHKIKELYDVHSHFLFELTKARNNSNLKLSQIFQQFKERFLIYGSFCANLTKAYNLLQELCDQDESFNQTVIKCEKEENNGRFKLRDVLSVPMQRILKYHLLLERLKDATEESHDEHTDLKRAWDGMKDVAEYINEAHRDVEHLNVIDNLQETIVDWEHEPEMKLSEYGKLIKDAELRIKAHDDQKTRNRYVFIFDKCILICKQLRGNQFAYRDILNIMEYHVQENHNRAVLNNQARWSYNFYLVKNSQQMVYTISVRTIELKEQIIRAISEAHDNLQPKSLSHTNHNLELHSFPSPVQCAYCCKYLKGLIFQGYQCQKCNIAVHKRCIPNSGRCGLPSCSTPPIVNSISDQDPLRAKLWYVGEMDRNVATEKLKRREKGTFLVRLSPRMGEPALSLKTSDVTDPNETNTVKHMKICSKSDGPGDSKKYYLSQARFFSSVEELILMYENYCLRENFLSLDDDTKLLYPYHQLRAVVLRNHDALDRSQLSVREGQVLQVIGKDGYREGWWKARTEDNEVGFFPVTIIKLEGEVKYD